MVIQAMVVATGEGSSWARSELTSAGSRFGGLTVRQPTLTGVQQTNMQYSKNFRLKVKNILQ